MKYAEQGNGNYGDDASLQGIEAPTEDEEETGFGLPGQSAVGTVGFFRKADIGNEDENSTELVAPKRENTTDVTGEPPIVSNEGLASVAPGSLSTIIGIGAKKMSLDARIAYVMGNGEPSCNHCERTFIPEVLGARMACTNCGCDQPNNDHGLGANNFSNVEGPTAGDLDAGKDIVKEEVKTGSTEEFMSFFAVSGDASKLYYQGYNDAQAGKPLDEDLALLSKDYYQGYEQYKFYNKTPQQSEGQKLFDIKPNSNSLPRPGVMKTDEVDAGPAELTDGMYRATASKSIFPIDVIQKFFEV